MPRIQKRARDMVDHLYLLQSSNRRFPPSELIHVINLIFVHCEKKDKILFNDFVGNVGLKLC